MHKFDIGNKIILFLRVLGKSLLFLCGGCILGTALLAIVFLLPVNEESYNETVALLDGESWYPIASQHNRGEYFGTLQPDVLDNSTDRIMLDIAMDSSGGVIFWCAQWICILTASEVIPITGMVM